MYTHKNKSKIWLIAIVGAVNQSQKQLKKAPLVAHWPFVKKSTGALTTERPKVVLVVVATTEVPPLAQTGCATGDLISLLNNGRQSGSRFHLWPKCQPSHTRWPASRSTSLNWSRRQARPGQERSVRATSGRTRRDEVQVQVTEAHVKWHANV